MIDEKDFEPTIAAPEREALTVIAERLERRRPVPRANFRGELRRHLLTGRHRPTSGGTRYRLWAVSYVALGALCLAVTAIGLAGVGPFAP